MGRDSSTMTRCSSETGSVQSRLRALALFYHPRLYLILRYCIAITIVVVLVYTANLKITVPNFQWAELSASSESPPDYNNNNLTIPHSTQTPIENFQHRFIGRKDINFILSRERALISRVLANYTFKDSQHLRDLVPEQGGNPLRALVATTWRSGSTFLGDILLSHPSTYYHYEPLLHFGIEQVRTGVKAREALRVLKSLFKCDYSNLGDYLKYGIDHNFLYTHNFHLWKRCQQFEKSLCWNSDFLTRMCKLFPFQSMKTVRLRFRLTKPILEDVGLNVKALLLVRDPRGTMESRHHRDWCPGNPDCEDPGQLCQDMVEDYYAAKNLTKQFPGRIKVIRYEDFSSDPYLHTHEVLDFFGLNFHPNVQNFLDTHTKINYGGVSSTFRDTKTAPFQWMKKLTFEEAQIVQKKCSKAMKLWGYKEADSLENYLKLEPLITTNFTLNP